LTNVEYYNHEISNTKIFAMATSLTSKGQVTIPKHVRDQLGISAGSQISFTVNERGQLVLEPCKPALRGKAQPADRFDRARGAATVKWRNTDELMRLLRGDEA
jgi:antitoxin PrlF